jgi:hypothetical protein
MGRLSRRTSCQTAKPAASRCGERSALLRGSSSYCANVRQGHADHRHPNVMLRTSVIGTKRTKAGGSDNVCFQGENRRRPRLNTRSAVTHFRHYTPQSAAWLMPASNQSQECGRTGFFDVTLPRSLASGLARSIHRSTQTLTSRSIGRRHHLSRTPLRVSHGLGHPRRGEL